MGQPRCGPQAPNMGRRARRLARGAKVRRMTEQGLLAHDETGGTIVGRAAPVSLRPLALEHFAILDALYRLFGEAVAAAADASPERPSGWPRHGGGATDWVRSWLDGLPQPGMRRRAEPPASQPL